MPPITAAIKTPKAPTPPRSSAAGGLEKLVEPVGREPLGVLLEELLAEEVDRPAVPELAPAVVCEVADAGFVSVDLLVEDVPVDAEGLDADEDVGGTEPLVAPEALAGRGDPVPEAPPPVDDPPPVLPEAVVPPVLPDEVGLALPEEELPEVEPDPTFSAVRSIVTGRLPPLDEAPAPDDEAAPLLPGLSDAPAPLPPDEDVPPEDFLSVAISSPPEPDRSQDIHYTHLFAKRYRRGKEFCALQKNDSPGSG